MVLAISPVKGGYAPVNLCYAPETGGHPPVNSCYEPISGRSASKRLPCASKAILTANNPIRMPVLQLFLHNPNIMLKELG